MPLIAEPAGSRTRSRAQGDGLIRRWALVSVIALLFVQAAQAARMPRHWHAPRWWLPQAICVHEHEGAWNANTGNGYFGGMQFLLSTWRSVGGTGYPHQRSPREQLYRSWLLYLRSGHSWSQWGTAGACHLR